MTKKPTKAQVRAQAVADRQRASEAAAKQRRNRIVLWGGLAIVVVIAIVVAVVAGSGGNSADATKYEIGRVKVTGDPLPTFSADATPDPAVGERIPTLQGTSVYDGRPVTVKPDGKPQAVVFVAHWCPHCQAEVPRLVELAKQGVFDGLEVTAVATGTNDQADNYPPSAWLKREDWPFPVMADSKSSTAATAYGLNAYPFFVLVDADGNVATRGSGEVSPDVIKSNVEKLLKGEPTSISSSGKSSAG